MNKIQLGMHWQAETQADMRNWNNAGARRAIREEIGDWIWVEASKGYRERAKLLFDQRGLVTS